jgi:hypothetical protein
MKAVGIQCRPWASWAGNSHMSFSSRRNFLGSFFQVSSEPSLVEGLEGFGAALALEEAFFWQAFR